MNAQWLSVVDNHAKPELHGEPEGACLENAWDPDRLVDTSPRSLPPSPRDPLSLC